MADITEQICEAVDIIVSKRLESINFDSTIIATIVSNREADQYKYICSNGSSQFIAYSKETNYKVNDSVYVTIPNNDYSQQKIIIGKYVAKDEKPFIFKEPFDTIIDLTENLVVEDSLAEKSLLANGDTEKILLWESKFQEQYSGYNRLGLSAQFKNYIYNYKPIQGNYGLKLEIESTIDSEKRQITTIELDSSMMYGNPYNFQTYFEQEKIYDISSVGIIKSMKLYFYQKNGSFLDKDKKPIPTVGSKGEQLNDNLFIKNPYICLGYDLSDFSDEKVILYTFNSDHFEINDKISEEEIKKNIKLRWIHKFEDGTIKVINENSGLSDYEIRWYQYDLGAPSADEYCGVYWKSVNKSESGKNFNYSFIPREKHNEERIKVIIIYNEKPYYSNILTFKNDKQVINDATVDLLNGLSIVCEDKSFGNYYLYGQNNNLLDESQSSRVRELQAYFGFTENNKSPEPSKLTEAVQIEWRFPFKNSMIVVNGFDYYKKEKLTGYYSNSNESIKLSDDETEIIITRTCNEEGKINAVQDYRVLKTYDQTKVNNTVKCTIRKNKIFYSATKNFTFGLMGTNGTDSTVVIDFDDNKIALTADSSSETVSLTAHLYDSTHNEISLEELKNKNIKFKWEWYNKYKYSGSQIRITESINRCQLSHGEINIEDNPFLILQVTVKNWGNYDLISYKAIPIRANKQYRGYIGPTSVTYSSSGYADYYKQKCKLLWCENAEEVSDHDYVINNNSIKNADNLTWEIGNPFGEQEQYLGSIEKDILQPVSIYIKNSNPYSIIAKNTDNKIVWIQPLVIIQNEYPSTTINRWDGKQLQLNDKEGYILSTAIAAGRKDDNKFSGVMIGDWSSTNTADDISKSTGIYGFNRGAISYAFKDDGTGFIGKSGCGRIIFKGDSGEIKSANWDLKKSGLFFNLDKGIIKLQENNHFITLSSEEEKYPLSIGTDATISSRKFKVEWDGTVWIQEGKIDGKITSEEGEIGGWTITEDTLSGGNTTLDSREGITTNEITISGNITADKKGKLGTIGSYHGSTGQQITYNIGIISNNQSIILDTMEAKGETYNIVFRSKNSTWAQCNNFYVMGKPDGGWMSKAENIELHSDKVIIDSNSIEFKANKSNQTGIYARFA